MADEEVCVTCGSIEIYNHMPEHSAAGIIYVRKQVDGKWRTYPQCRLCWDKENPLRAPHQFLTSDEKKLRGNFSLKNGPWV